VKVCSSTAITGGRREYVESVRKIRAAQQDLGVEILN
jgi:hypothetical protein